MAQPNLSVNAESYAGYKAEVTPRRFTVGTRTVEVMDVLDRWVTPEHAYYRVAGDGGSYVLGYDVTADRWEITEQVPAR